MFLMPLQTIPFMNWCHPISSCSFAINSYLCAFPRQMSIIATLPLPLAVSTSSSHVPRRSMDFSKASTLPAWLQYKMCEHVSGTCAQLRHRGLTLLSQGKLAFAGVIFITCLHAHSRSHSFFLSILCWRYSSIFWMPSICASCFSLIWHSRSARVTIILTCRELSAS